MESEMKNNKLDSIIFKYLENKNFIIKKTITEYYFLEDESDRSGKIKIMKDDAVCFIDYDLIKEIQSFFSVETNTSKDIITRYVENILNIEVSKSYLANNFNLWIG